MSRTTAPTRSRDRQATEDALVRAASALFAELGYDRATTRAVAEAAGYSEALIQRYFGGKEGLLLAVLRQEKAEHADEATFFARPLCPTLAEEALQLLRYTTRDLARMAERLRIVLSRTLQDPGFRSEFHRLSVRTGVRMGLESRLARYQAAGLLDRWVDLGAATEMLLGLAFHLGFVHRELLETSPDVLQQYTTVFATLYGRALAPAEAGGATPPTPDPTGEQYN